MRQWTALLIVLTVLIFPLTAQEPQPEGFEKPAQGFEPAQTSETNQETPRISLSARIVPSIVVPGDSGTIEITYSIPEGAYLAKQEQFFFFTVDTEDWLDTGPIFYPAGTEKDGLTIYKEKVTLGRDFSVAADAPLGEKKLSITAGYQFCDENGVCFIPRQEELAVRLDVADTSAAGLGIGLATVLQYLLMALAGGILLNIMPCVLPLLSVKALNLVNQSNQDRRKILINSLVYTGGILASFLIIAGLVVALKLSGELVGWGFQFQNPGFVMVLISVIFVFALSMFDVFIITAPGMNIAAKASSRSGYLGSFLTGIFAVLVATPCTAPFLGAALGFAFTQPPLIIFLILIFVGIGLAFPFILLGIWPAFIQKLPKPGNWMNIFKEIMGFLLLGTVIYMLNTLYHQIGGANLVRVLIFLGILSFASWIYGRFGKPGSTKLSQWISLAAAVAIVVFSASLILDFSNTSGVSGKGTAGSAGNPAGGTSGNQLSEVTDIDRDGMWRKFSPDVVERLRDENVPVFISFTAQWCTTCKVNEATVLSTDDIQKAFESYGIVPLKGDYTSRDEVIGRWIERFGKAGVPVNALFVPGREEAIVFPEILTKKMLIEAFEERL